MQFKRASATLVPFVNFNRKLVFTVHFESYLHVAIFCWAKKKRKKVKVKKLYLYTVYNLKL